MRQNAKVRVCSKTLVPRLAKNDELLLQTTSQSPNVHDGCHTIFDKFAGCESQCGSGYSNTGYSFSNLIRASSVVNRQRTFASVRFR